MTEIATIGYEGRAQHDVLRLLAQDGVDLLVDVRIRAQSRKPGLSKTSLTAGLAEAGIEYLHLRDLGTPLDIRAKFRANDLDVARAEYRDYVRGDEDARRALERLAELAKDRSVAILCYEHDHRVCHRQVVAEELLEQFGIAAHHLGSRG